MPFADPRQNLGRLHLKEGEHVADFGCGPGRYALLSAERVGTTGRVYAVDVQKDLLRTAASAAREEGYGNVETLWGDVEERGGSKLASGSVNAVIISNLLFQVGDKDGVVEEAARVLASGGRVLLVDWSDSFSNTGPAPEMVFPEAEARRLCEDKGFQVGEAFPAGDHHYGFIATKQS